MRERWILVCIHSSQPTVCTRNLHLIYSDKERALSCSASTGKKGKQIANKHTLSSLLSKQI